MMVPDPFHKKSQCLDCEQCFEHNPLFDLLSSEEKASLNEKRVEVFFKKGEVIYKQGMPLTHLVIIRRGFGKIYIEGPKNKDLILSYSVPFHLNGGVGIFIDEIHHSSLMAASDCETCLIEVKTFKKVLRNNPDFMEAYFREYSERILSIFHQFTVLTQKNMEARMADALLYIRENVCMNLTIQNVSKNDLSDFTAMSRESAIRVLKDFKEKGLVEMENHHITILQENLLKEIAEEG